VPRLQIYDRRERALVGLADPVLAAAASVASPFRRRVRVRPPRRILLLRLERIGDLLMVLPAIADIRARAPDAEIDLVVGSWNRELASHVPDVTRVETLDASWLAREAGGSGPVQLLGRIRRWRARGYDLAINFEPDIRSNLLLAASGAAWIAGYESGGGGPLLDQALTYDQRQHTTDNARRLAAAVLPGGFAGARRPLLNIPDGAARKAASILPATKPRPWIAVHVSGGRAIKQWDPARFAEVSHRLVDAHGATIVLTGSEADRPLVDLVKAAVPHHAVVDAAGALDLPDLAALLDRVALVITGDTGPMHLAVAVGTPVVAVFGPSAPERYRPLGADDRVVRVDLPCSPCNRIRLPPARCVGHTPDCLAEIPVDRVYDAAVSILESRSIRAAPRNALA
jgi:ADP-heptose:LPS heptosyltransferase